MPMKLPHKSSVGMIACQNLDHPLQIPVSPVRSIGRIKQRTDNFHSFNLYREEE
jgi:hypothetical protein